MSRAPSRHPVKYAWNTAQVLCLVLFALRVICPRNFYSSLRYTVFFSLQAIIYALLVVDKHKFSLKEALVDENLHYFGLALLWVLAPSRRTMSCVPLAIYSFIYLIEQSMLPRVQVFTKNWKVTGLYFAAQVELLTLVPVVLNLLFSNFLLERLTILLGFNESPPDFKDIPGRMEFLCNLAVLGGYLIFICFRLAQNPYSKAVVRSAFNNLAAFVSFVCLYYLLAESMPTAMQFNFPPEPSTPINVHDVDVGLTGSADLVA